MRYFEFRAMNTVILLAAEGPEEQVQNGFLQAQAFIQAGERRFTRFSEDSELSELNRSAGTWFSASPELYEVVSKAARLHRQTGGLFDPAILDALEQAGVDQVAPRAGEDGAREEDPRDPLLLVERRRQDQQIVDALAARTGKPEVSRRLPVDGGVCTGVEIGEQAVTLGGQIDASNFGGCDGTVEARQQDRRRRLLRNREPGVGSGIRGCGATFAPPLRSNVIMKMITPLVSPLLV